MHQPSSPLANSMMIRKSRWRTKTRSGE